MTQDPRLVAYVAARQWADDHRHQTPDDRMLDIVYAAGYGQGRDDGRLRGMLHQIAWHAEDAANLPTEDDLRDALRRLARVAARIAEGDDYA